MLRYTYVLYYHAYVLSVVTERIMKLTASRLRQEIYKILDEVIRTGKPIEIERNGSLLKIIAVKHNFNKLAKLKKRRLSDEDSDHFEHIDWTGEWKGRK